MSNDVNFDLDIIKRAPTYWRYLPYLSKTRGLLFINRIYLRADIFDNILTDSATPHNVSVLIHEQTHYNRMLKQGMIPFGIKYLFSRSGRYEEEFAAITEQMRYLKKYNAQYDIRRGASALSGPYYLWCTKYETAYTELSKCWENL